MFGLGAVPAHTADTPTERMPFRTANVAFAREQEEAARHAAAMHRLPLRTSENGPAPRGTDGGRGWTPRRARKVLVRVCIVLAAASAASLLPRASSSVVAPGSFGAEWGDCARALGRVPCALRPSLRGLGLRGVVPLVGLRLRGGQDDPVENHVRGFRARYLELFGVEREPAEEEEAFFAYQGGGDTNDNENPWGRHAEEVPEPQESKAALGLERQMTGVGGDESSARGSEEAAEQVDRWGNTVIDLTDMVEVGPQDDTDYYLDLFKRKNNVGGMQDGIAHFAEERAEDSEQCNASYLFDARNLTGGEGGGAFAFAAEAEEEAEILKCIPPGSSESPWGARADAYLPIRFAKVNVSCLHKDQCAAGEEESKWGLYVDERGIGKVLNGLSLNGSCGSNVSVVRVRGYLNDETLNGSRPAGAPSNASWFAQRSTKYRSEDLSRLWMAMGSGLGLNGSDEADCLALNAYPSAVADDPVEFLEWIDSCPRSFVRRLVFCTTDQVYVKTRRFDEAMFKQWCDGQDVRYGGRVCGICDAEQSCDARAGRLDHRLDVVLPDQYEHVLEGIQNLRDGGRLVVKATEGDYAWDMPLVVSGEALNYTDFDTYMKELVQLRMAGDTQAGAMDDDRFHWPDALCHVHDVVLNASTPLRVFGIDTSEGGEHDVGLGSYEGKGVRMWGPWHLERGSAGSFAGVQLLHNDTLPRRWEEPPNVALNENRSLLFPPYKTVLPDSDLGELEALGYEPIPDDFGCISHLKTWTPSQSDLQRDDWSGYTAEPCVQVWEGPWLFSHCGIKCAAGTALLLGYEADLMALECEFGGMGRGEYFVWEPTHVGRRCLEASYIVWAMHSAALAMERCTLIDSHSAVVKLGHEARVTMRECTADGSRRGCFLDDNATLAMYNSSLLSLVRGALWPMACESSTLHIDSCRIQGPMWANETWARGLLARGRLRLSGRANTFLPTEGLAPPAPRTFERAPRLIPTSVAPGTRKGKFGHFYSMLGVDRDHSCTHHEHGSDRKVERERRARIEAEAAVPQGDDSLFFRRDSQQQPGGT